MNVARALHMMAKTYGKAPHELMNATPVELSFDLEVYMMATAAEER